MQTVGLTQSGKEKPLSEIRKPAFRLWIEGKPRSANKRPKSMSRYVGGIKEVAHKAIPNPTGSRRIDIEIFFVAQTSLRVDVDNVIKPILDALKGIVYLDDSQVRSVKVTSLPENDAFALRGWVELEVLERLLKKEPKEILINIFEGLSTPSP